jgi:hypothetical protein
VQVADAPGKAINQGDHQNVAGMQEFQHRPECLAALGRGAAPFLRRMTWQPAALSAAS